MITQKLLTGATIALIALQTLNAGQGTFITEPFSCDVALADLAHLTETVKENNPQFIQEQLELSLKLTIKELAEHSECGEVK